MISIGEIETILKETGGDYEKFREKVTNEVKSEFKKCIGSDTDRIEKYRQYLYEAGYTDVKISQDVIAKSETAKEFKKACALQEDDTAVETLQALRDAGITYEDAYALYLKRSNSIKSTDYSSGELAWPVDGNSRISSYYGHRSSPGGIGSTNHQGIDIAASAGTNVMAADGGKVSYTGYNRSRGYYVDVDHGNGRKTRYQHLQGYTVLKGDVVKKGDLIAYVGSTGNSTGPHLHIEVLEGGQTVDPMIYFH
ncbi:M23 family metallopeptidase [Clostridiales Family XIII bacterium ASD5510]|uniref:M23 family metallopeptidase n=3 Tax=Bacteria TaxID=2 RepID=A0A9J6QWP5_9FIRM|nr:M23 family metallopeptidase [Hominibacterium faecale]